MVPTSAKNADFVCHACKAVVVARKGGGGEGEAEVNVPSRVGGMGLTDVLGRAEGIASFREFLNHDEGEEQNDHDDDHDDDATRRVDFCIATSEFQSNKNDDNANNSIIDHHSIRKKSAQHIFDTYCARDAKRKVKLPSAILSAIDASIFNNNDSSAASPITLSPNVFDAARNKIMQSLETEYLERYKQSSTFRSYLALQRTTMIQKERPTECALCSVKTGLHAMHPLYDFHGPEGRQLVLPASGVGFRRKEKRLAWVHCE